ncbi:MAG: hypothetical protein HQ567_31560 [Candidatus Nealsonbacteria bacterium]|nr:hypothetical protein [Candidatus Nealsonbacteria bacterium]
MSKGKHSHEQRQTQLSKDRPDAGDEVFALAEEVEEGRGSDSGEEEAGEVIGMSRRKLALVILFGLIVLLLQTKPIYDVDFFWQLKAGELTLERGELIRKDLFTSTHPGDPVPPIGWAAQVVYAVVHQIGSWRLLHQLNAVIFAGALLAAALAVKDRETSLRGSLAAVALAALVVMPHCDVRPQTFALFAFALLLLVAEIRLRPALKLAVAAVILVVWQNMHPSWMLAAAVFGARAGAGWLRWLFDRQADKPWLASGLVLMAVLSAMATPMGWTIFDSTGGNAQIARELEASEWMPLWHAKALDAGAKLAWVALGVSVVLLGVLRRRVRLEDLATFVVTAAISLPIYRLSLFMAVAMVPVWSRWIAEAWPASSDTPDEAASKPAVPLRRSFALGVAAIVLIGALALPRLAGFPLFHGHFPFVGMEAMRKAGIVGTIYNYREWGGPLIWKGYPGWKVTIDGRLYLFEREQWNRYEEIRMGRVPVAQIECWYEPDAFFLRPGHDGRLIRLLRDSRAWQELHSDRNSAVFVRTR